jgi:hypothetical protein
VASTAPSIPATGGVEARRRVASWPRLAAALLLCLVPGLGRAFDLPPLTGRVVDQAGVIPAGARDAIET